MSGKRQKRAEKPPVRFVSRLLLLSMLLGAGSLSVWFFAEPLSVQLDVLPRRVAEIWRTLDEAPEESAGMAPAEDLSGETSVAYELVVPPAAQQPVEASSSDWEVEVRRVLKRFRETALRRSGEICNNLLRLQKVAVSGNYRLDRDTVLKEVNLRVGDWIWQIPFGEVRQRLMRLSWVESADFHLRAYPPRIEIRITEAEPWLVAEFDGRSWLVSRQGRIIESLSTLSSPDLIIEASELKRLDGLDVQAKVDSVFSSANARLSYAVKGIRLLELGGDLPFKIERFTLMEDGALKLHPADPGKVPEVIIKVLSFPEATKKVERLKAVLEDLESRGERASQLDLRFPNQVVVN